MSEEKHNHEIAEPTPVQTRAGSQNATGADYEVGYGRAPVATRFKPGRSGNPKGRPKGRKNLKTELKGIVHKKITIRDGEGEQKLSLFGANLLAHAVKGAKGDARSSGLFISNAQKLGLLEEQDDRGDGRYAVAAPTANFGAIDRLLENVEPDRMTRDENVELSRLGEIIELGGDITALSTGDFDRLKFLLNKGRGKDVTPRH